MRRCLIAAALLASLVLSGCSGARPNRAQLEATTDLDQTRYAVLFGNIFSGYRDADDSAEGLLWLIDAQGRVLSRSGSFAPISAAALRSDGSTTWFTGSQSGYRLSAAGLDGYPREHEPGSIGLVHLRSGKSPIATVNIGIAGEGEYETRVMELDSPENDVTVPRYVDALATCGASDYLLTTEGLSPGDARWERLQTQQVMAEHAVASTDGIGTISMVCEQDVILAVDQQRDSTGKVRQVVLHRWDTGDAFADSPVTLTQGRDGVAIGVDGTWDDGSRMPTTYWRIAGALFWLTASGEVWKTDVDSGASERAFSVEAADPANPQSCTAQPDSVVCAQRFQDRIEINSYRLPDGATEAPVVVKEVPGTPDLTVMDIAMVDLHG